MQVGREFEVEGGQADGESTRINWRPRGLHRREKSRQSRKGLRWGGVPVSWAKSEGKISVKEQPFRKGRARG